MSEINKELRRKQNHLSQQMRTLVEERADLQALLQEQSRTVTALNKRLGVAQRDNEDLVQSQVRGFVDNSYQFRKIRNQSRKTLISFFLFLE